MAEELEVGMKCIKYMLFVANFMFVMIGFLLVSIGSTIKAIYGDFEVFMASHYFSPATLAIVIGVFIFVVAIFGCVGALKESTCLINTFAFFLTLILILEVAAAIAAYAMRSDIESTIHSNMKEALFRYNSDRYDRDAWDFTQERLHCCGIDGSRDWYLIKLPQKNTTQSWNGPQSCCRKDKHWPKGEKPPQCPVDTIWKSGCLDSLTYIVSECALLLGCGALAVAFIQILGIVFAHMLAKAVRRIKTQNIVERENNRQKLYEQLARGNDDKPTPVLYTTTSATEA